ncbi:MAG: OadG family transporter subunit [Eubacteriales bacterium]|nr:OadG family transporter subunit [Eubacteriales bacterium]
MDIINSLLTSIFGMSVVFLVLVSLILLIYLQSYLLKKFHVNSAVPKANQAQVASSTQQTATPAVTTAVTPDSGIASIARPQLKLFNIDDKTAAMVMAIVCAESDIPAPELVFKSIRLLEDTPAVTS